MDPEEIIFEIESHEYIEVESESTESMEEIEDEDEDFFNAVISLVSMEKASQIEEEEPERKKQKMDEKPTLSERQILHRIMGCRHCKCRLGYVEDEGIHKKIDEIFNKMKQTVVVT